MLRLATALMVALPAVCGTIFTIDTSSLISNPNGPFTADFQFTDGSGTGDGNNTITISNFSDPSSLTLSSQFGGVAVITSPLSFTLTDTSFFNDIQFILAPDASLSFDLDATQNFDVGTPDTFIFDILDRNLNNIPTLNPNNGIAFIEVDLPTTSPTAATQIITSASDPSNTDGVNIAAPTESAVAQTPEPSSLCTEAVSLALVLLMSKTRVKWLVDGPILRRFRGEPRILSALSDSSPAAKAEIPDAILECRG